MSKQIVKSLMMMTLAVGLALASTVASANGPSLLVTADIPFDFIIADQTFSSGKYTVRKVSDDGKGLRISSVDGKSSVMRLSNLAVEKSKKPNARLVFHRYGQQYFLAEVWSGDTYGRQLIECKKERRLRQEQALIASGKSSYEVVEVVAMVR